MKDKSIAYMLWAACFLGVCGLQRLYSGKIGTGLLYLFTFGLFGIGQFVDLFLIPGMIEDANNRLLVGQAAQGRLAAAGGAGLPVLKRQPRTTEEMQVALVQAAEKHGGKLTIAEAVAETGRGFQEVKRQLDGMAINGFIELDSDEAGSTFYRFPGLEPSA